MTKPVNCDIPEEEHRVVILHLSDLHSGGRGAPWEREKILGNSWSECVARIGSETRVDLVCFTGDAAYSGNAAEYGFAGEFLRKRVLDPLGLEASRFFVVPGNHDICRDVEWDSWSRMRDVARKTDARSFSRLIESYTGGNALPEAEHLKRLLKRRDGYRGWVAEMCPQCDPKDRLAYHLTVMVRGITVHIMGLDTAWLSGDENDHEQLWLTEDQLMYASTTGDGKPLSGLRIALMHHPLAELHAGDRKRCSSKMADQIDLTLRGHLHESMAAVTREPGRESVELAAGCLFETKDGEDYRNGAQVLTVTVNDEGRPSRVDIWSLAWSYESGEWVDDNGRYRGSRHGRVSLPVSGESASWKSSRGLKSKTVRDSIRDDRSFIEEWTRDFVGREFVFERLRSFMAAHRSGYFIVQSDPGIGKTAFAAQCVKKNDFIHHFNCRAEMINSAELFLKNVCAQIISRYNLDCAEFPDDIGRSGETLKSLLNHVAPMLAAEGKVLVLVVDGLDEVDLAGLNVGENVLYLPKLLPERTYIVATMRARAQVPLNIASDLEIYEIEHNSRENEQDIRMYLEQRLKSPKIQTYLRSHGLTEKDFVSELTVKSAGNFIYLRYILPQIEAGVYSNSDASSLPQGLESYYRDHWRLMQGRDEALWWKYRLPVIVALASAEKPISVDLISRFTGIAERARIQAVIEEWKQFLRQIKVSYEGGTQNRYAVYHWSFHEFLRGLEVMKEARVDLQAADRSNIASLAEGLFDADGSSDQ